MAHPLKAPQQQPFQLVRPPLNDDELWWLVYTMWGVQIPRVKICDDHVAPFTAFAHAFFARSPFALWYGSRGTGKSLMLALLGLTRAVVLESDVTILGGSMAQSMNVHGHIEDFMGRPNAPRQALHRLIDSELEWASGNTIKPLPASQTTVRGPHPQTCVAGWTLLSTPEGPERIDALTVGRKVLVSSDMRSARWGRVQAVLDQGRRDTMILETSTGREICLTPDHEVWTARGWVRADGLEPGDALVAQDPFAGSLTVAGLRVGPPTHVWDVTTDAGNFFADGVLVHNCLLDEIDEMDKKIYDAAQGQPMEKPNARGMPVLDLMIASSTWQRPIGTFQEVLDMCKEKDLPVFSWCFLEQLEPHGWMKKAFVEAKRKTVPAEMFRVEYELGEPDGGQRAFDLTKIEQYFVEYPTPLDERHAYHDDMWIWEKPNPMHSYAIGADWAKSKDMTVIVVFRTDIYPRKVAYLRILNRRPWPVMIEMYNDQQNAYNAVGAHDATGLGSVVSDYVDERTSKIHMIGQKRTQLINEYIVAFEQGHYLLPRQTAMYKGHRDTSVDDVYSPARWDAHLNDDVAAAAIAHRAAERQAPPGAPQGAGREERGPAAYQGLIPERRDDSAHVAIVGEVTRESDGDLWSGGIWTPGSHG